MAFDLIRRVQSLGHPRLLVVGDLILDRYIWGDAERISQEAPVPLLRADAREHRLGGAASVATMLARPRGPGPPGRRRRPRPRGRPRPPDARRPGDRRPRRRHPRPTARPRSRSGTSAGPRTATPSR